MKKNFFIIFIFLQFIGCWGERFFAPTLSFSFSKKNNSPFGVNAHQFGNNFNYLPYIKSAGIKWARVDFWWAQIEKEKGNFDFTFFDKMVVQAKKNNINLLPVLGGAPQWALTAENKLKNSKDYAEFVFAVVNHFKGKIKYYEIWNEPNNITFKPPFAKVKEYAKILKISYLAAKKADKNCQVLMGGLAGGIDFAYTEGIYKFAGKNFFDVMNIHPYRALSFSPEKGNLEEDILNLKKLMKKYNDEKKEIWVSEIGWPTSKGLQGGWLGVSEETQANYLIRSYVILCSQGIKKFFWYDAVNDGTDEKYFEHNQGLLTNDLKPKKSYLAYKTLTKFLAGFSFYKNLSPNKRVRFYVFKKDKKFTGILWDHISKTNLKVKTKNNLKFYNREGEEILIKENQLLINENPIFVIGDYREVKNLFNLIFNS